MTIINGASPLNICDDRIKGIPEELQNSAEKILDYANISEERAEQFIQSLDAFRNLRNKSSVDRETQNIKAVLTDGFTEAYLAVFKRVITEDNHSLLYQMFLNYGYMDESLLTAEQSIELYELAAQPNHSQDTKVYDMKTWYEKIYRMEVDPSVNEFGQDYFEIFRDKKRKGELREEDKADYNSNVDGRLLHETNGLLKMGQRLCYGRMSGYFPILYNDMIVGSLSRSLVTPAKIENCLEKILAVDFSAFHREVVYSSPTTGTTKELIMIPIRPEIILVPTFGCHAVMWQEITGKVKKSPGRFILPVFTSENLDKMMADIVAKFRWELSKSMLSRTKSSVYESSLVGDYTDYIQFYKKNRDLSHEGKGKLKTQIDRNRNNIKEIFADDYYNWINYESKGLVRLNKVARGILFKHCLFSSNIRERLENQPMFSKDINQVNYARDKQHQILSVRYAKMVKSGMPLDEDLTNSLRYYKM